jgi:hypothetical protein
VQGGNRMPSWGDINAALNRLVGEGTITGFKTNLGERGASGGLHVIVTAPVITDPRKPGFDRRQVAAVRRAVATELKTLADLVTVTVRGEP